MKIKDEIEREREIEEIKETILQRVADRMVKTNNTRPNHAVGEVYKPAALNTHDPHDMHVWANNKPWWLRPLQVVGFVAAGIGLTICIYYSTLIVLSL